MKDTKKLVSISKINKFGIIPFLVPFFCMLNHYFQEKQFKEATFKYGKYQFPTLFNNFISKILSFIFIIISNRRIKSEIKQNEKQKKIYHELVEKKKSNTMILYSFIFLISFLEVIFKVEDFYLMYLQREGEIKGKLIEKRMGFVILIPILSFCLLKKKLYRHHFFSLCLTGIGFVLLNVVEFYIEKSKYTSDYIFHIIHLLFSGTFALSLVLIKYTMIYYFISPYKFLFIDGIFSIVNSFIFIFILKFIFFNKDSDYIISNFSNLLNQPKMYYVYLSFSIIFSFFYYFLNVLSLFYFSPCINVLTDLISPFLLWLLQLLTNSDNSSCENKIISLPLKFIAYLIILFGAFILNEIIIFNCCELNKGTYNNIVLRGIEDTDQSNCINNLSIGGDQPLSEDFDDDDTIENERIENQIPINIKVTNW